MCLSLTGRFPLPTKIASLVVAYRILHHVELRFCAELRTLDQRIMADVPAAKRGEHASKTYHMLVGAADVARDAPPGDGFFALGQFRSAEKARAHLHSSYATGIYDLGHLELSDSVQKVQEAAGISAPAVRMAQHR